MPLSHGVGQLSFPIVLRRVVDSFSYPSFLNYFNLAVCISVADRLSMKAKAGGVAIVDHRKEKPREDNVIYTVVSRLMIETNIAWGRGTNGTAGQCKVKGETTRKQRDKT